MIDFGPLERLSRPIKVGRRDFVALLLHSHHGGGLLDPEFDSNKSKPTTFRLLTRAQSMIVHQERTEFSWRLHE